MSDYYLKLKIKDMELEISTSDIDVFEKKSKEFAAILLDKEKLSEVNPEEKELAEEIENHDDKITRSDFIDYNQEQKTKIKDLESIKVRAPQNEFQVALKKALDKDDSAMNVNLSKDKELVKLFDLHNPKNDLSLFLLTAAYLLEMNSQDSFSLKQVNSRVYPIKEKLIPRKIVQDALNLNLIEVFPDLTKTSIVTEYALTSKGEDFLRNEL